MNTISTKIISNSNRISDEVDDNNDLQSENFRLHENSNLSNFKQKTSPKKPSLDKRGGSVSLDDFTHKSPTS